MDNPEQEKEILESKIVIRFASPNSSLFDIDFINVSALQAIAAAWMLKHKAETLIILNEQHQMAEAAKKAELSRIAVPGKVQ